MPIKKTKDINVIVKEYAALQNKIPRLVGNTAVNTFKRNFQREGFITAGRLEKWIPRAVETVKTKGRAILVQSGAMKRSIRVLMQMRGFVQIGTDKVYASIHNKGGNIRGTFKVRKHSRKKRGGKPTTVKAHSRTVDITIPKRKFIGQSTATLIAVNRILIRELKRILG